MKKIIVILMTLVVLFSCTAVPLYADAWIPPDDLANERLITAVYNNETCSAINIFLSNYIETGIISFDSSSNDDLVIASMLKHFELNAQAYGTSVKSDSSSYGQYMMIKGSEFENRTKTIFARNITSSSVDGYNNGWIYVTSESYNTPIRCFASAKDITYIGNGEYMVNFEIFISSKNIEDLYGVSYYDLDKTSLTSLGEGYCYFNFKNPTATKFKPSNFTIISIDCDKYTVPHNTSCTPCDPDGSPLGEESTETTYAETTEVVTEEVTEVIAHKGEETETATEKVHEKPSVSQKPGFSVSSKFLTLIIASGIVILSAVVAIVLIIIFTTRNKK